mmetsp:Transcript_18156/g.45787  ORF Transcript_18156/g.45787 Transcript_18156/m.45787 type:complete len:235 (+) Transcript_18156:226-930(+)
MRRSLMTCSICFDSVMGALCMTLSAYTSLVLVLRTTRTSPNWPVPTMRWNSRSLNWIDLKLVPPIDLRPSASALPPATRSTSLVVNMMSVVLGMLATRDALSDAVSGDAHASSLNTPPGSSLPRSCTRPSSTWPGRGTSAGTSTTSPDLTRKILLVTGPLAAAMTSPGLYTTSSALVSTLLSSTSLSCARCLLFFSAATTCSMPFRPESRPRKESSWRLGRHSMCRLSLATLTV